MNKVKRELCFSVFKLILIFFFLVLSSCVRSVLLGEFTFHKFVYMYLLFFFVIASITCINKCVSFL